jgi:hypothetical protein
MGRKVTGEVVQHHIVHPGLVRPSWGAAWWEGEVVGGLVCF